MELIFWWMPIVWIVAIAPSVVVAVLVWKRMRARLDGSRPVARMERLTDMPAYRSALRRYRALLGAILVSGILLVSSSVALASRPATTTVVAPELNNRDIVLCLDVSGSMIEYDARIVEVFAQLATEFDGDRLSLVVFNASAVTYFPLTSDYAYVTDRLAEVGAQFASEDASYFDGTFFGDGSSLIGDGLAACTQRFDTPEENRSRSVVLATDNLLIGQPIFTLPEAGQLATSQGIRVYGLNPGDSGADDYLASLADEYEKVVTDTGGAYFRLDDPAAVESIVTGIAEEEATAITGAPQVVRTDTPGIPALIALCSLAALLGLAWRVGG